MLEAAKGISFLAKMFEMSRFDFIAIEELKKVISTAPNHAFSGSKMTKG